jgi:hypothetical protein
MKLPKLYIGPMSKNVVDAAIELGIEKNIPIGFCASRRQIEWDGGYVNNWTTKSFIEYVKGFLDDIIVVRDHGGPDQGKNFDGGLLSFEYDANSMDIIHIDPWKRYSDIIESAYATALYINFCNNINRYCMYEIGTEQSIYEISPSELETFLDIVLNEVGIELFNKVLYVVIQSGTSLEEDKNTGNYNEDRLKKMIEVCKKYFVLSKEHNGDYISGDIIKKKFDLGLEAINIAPEFGTIETLCVLDRIGNDSKLFEELYKICFDSGKWVKWVSSSFDPEHNKRKLIKICGHYIFSDNRFKEMIKSALFIDMEDDIKIKVKNRMLEIVDGVY